MDSDEPAVSSENHPDELSIFSVIMYRMLLSMASLRPASTPALGWEARTAAVGTAALGCSCTL